MSSGYRLAIDYGAAETSAATIDAGGTATALDIGGRATVPSILVVSRGVVIAGQAAAEAAAARPGGAIRAAKRKLGTPDPIARAPREVVPEDGAAATLALVVREALDQHAGEPPAEVVLAVPANASQAYADALDASLRIAGVAHEVPIRHVPEDIAAACRLASAVAEGAVVVVLDMGVRLTASVLRRTPDGYVRMGEPLIRDDLGGDRIDDLLAGHVLGRLDPTLAAALRDPQTPGDAAARAAFVIAVREAKVQASTDPAGAVLASPQAGGAPLTLSRLALETVVAPALLEAVDSVEAAVRASGIGAAEVEVVCLTGGSSALPRLDDLIADRFGRVASEAGRRKLAVALGAAAGLRPAPSSPEPAVAPAAIEEPGPAPAGTSAAAIPVAPPPPTSGVAGSAVTPLPGPPQPPGGPGTSGTSGQQPWIVADPVNPAARTSNPVRFLPAALVIGGGLVGLLTLVVDWWTRGIGHLPSPLAILSDGWSSSVFILYPFLAMAVASLALIAVGIAWAVGGRTTRPGVPVALAAGAALVISPFLYVLGFPDLLADIGPAPLLAAVAGLAALVGAGIAARSANIARRWPALIVAAGGLAGLAAAGLPTLTTDAGIYMLLDEFEQLLGPMPLVAFLVSCVLVVAAGAMASHGEVRLAGRGVALGASALLLLGLAYILFNLATSHVAALISAGPDIGLFLFLAAAAAGFAGTVIDFVVAGQRTATTSPHGAPASRW